MTNTPENLDTPEALQEQLIAYQRAIKQEFEDAMAAVPDDVQELTRSYFKKNAAMLAARVVHLAEHAESEAVQLNAAKFGLQTAFADAEGDGDPIKQLLSELKGNDSKPQPASSPVRPQLVPSNINAQDREDGS